MAIKIDFLANTSSIVRGTQDVEQQLEKVGDSLDDVARDGQQSTDRLERSFRDLAAASKKVDPGVEIGHSFKRGTEEADEGVRTLKENTASNLKEVAASFDGSAQGISDGVQGLVAELLEGFGPGGLLAGALLAGGIGLISTQMQGAQQATEEETQAAKDLAAQLIETGRSGRSLGDISDQLKTIATDGDAVLPSLAEIQREAKQVGVPFKDLVQIYLTGGRALDEIIDRTAKAADAQAAYTQELSGGGAFFVQDPVLEGLQKQVVNLQKVKQQWKTAQEEQQAYIKAGGPELKAKAEATATYAESVQSALQDAGDSWSDYQKGQKVNLDKYNNHMEDSIKAIEDYQNNVKYISGKISQQALNYILSLGEKAAPLLQAYVDAPNDMQARTAANWDRLGKRASDAYNQSLQDGVPAAIDGPVIRAPRIEPPSRASLEAARRQAQAYLDAHPLRAGAIAYTPYGKPLYG